MTNYIKSSELDLDNEDLFEYISNKYNIKNSENSETVHENKENKEDFESDKSFLFGLTFGQIISIIITIVLVIIVYSYLTSRKTTSYGTLEFLSPAVGTNIRAVFVK